MSARCLEARRGVAGVPLEGEIQGVEDAARELVVGEALLPSLAGGPVEGGAQQAYLHEVVEVACLEGGVLAVVGEGEDLARLSGLRSSSLRPLMAERLRMVVAVLRPSEPRRPAW